MATFLFALSVAMSESVVLEVLKRFVPLLGGAMPPLTSDPRLRLVERNRFFVTGVVGYLCGIFLVAVAYAILPFLREVFVGPSEGWPDTNYISLSTAKLVGPLLPDVTIPGDLYSLPVWRAAMITLPLLMLISGVLFWPVWRLASALGYDSFEWRRSLHVHSVLISSLVCVWLLFWLFLPFGLIGALLLLLALLGITHVLTELTNTDRAQ